MAPKKRGMSLEEKRSVILSIFHETKDVFLLKDIEKLASKRGVVLQSVKEVLQSLVDDDLVNQDKIGISNFFWSFPSEAAVKLENEHNKLSSRIEALQKEASDLEERIEIAKQGKESSADREQLQRRIHTLQESVNEKKREMELFSVNDPERYEGLIKARISCRDSANRWTENLFLLKGWMNKKFPGMEKQVETFFVQQGVPEDIEYLE